MNSSYKFFGVLLVASVMLILPVATVAEQVTNSAGIVINSSASSSTSEIYQTSFQTVDAYGNTIYVTADVWYNSSSNALTYISTQQVSAGNGGGQSWELAGGLGTTQGTATWTVTSGIEDPSYSPNPASSSNPPSYWSLPSSGFLPIDQPNNAVSWGQSTSVTVTTGITAGVSASASVGVTTVGVGLTGSYSITYSWNEYQFLLEPIYQSMYNDSWYFSDNQGITGSSPYSATSIESSTIYAVQGNYNHVWYRDWGQFVYFTSSWFGLVHTPHYDVVYTNDGVTTPFIS